MSNSSFFQDGGSEDTEEYSHGGSEDTPMSSQATEEYSQASLPSSQETELYFKDDLWGPIRLYREAGLNDNLACLQWYMAKQLVFSQMNCRIHRCLYLSSDSSYNHLKRMDEKTDGMVKNIQSLNVSLQGKCLMGHTRIILSLW